MLNHFPHGVCQAGGQSSPMRWCSVSGLLRAFAVFQKWALCISYFVPLCLYYACSAKELIVNPDFKIHYVSPNFTV